MNGWKPIETCPRHKQFIAILQVNHRDGTSWWEYHVLTVSDEGHIADNREQGWRLEDYEGWQELPAPPGDLIRQTPDTSHSGVKDGPERNDSTGNAGTPR